MFYKLPHEIIVSIFEYIKEEQLAPCLFVCREWYDIVQYMISQKLKEKCNYCNFLECCEKDYILSIRKPDCRLNEYQHGAGFVKACTYKNYNIAKYIVDNFSLALKSVAKGQKKLSKQGNLDLIKYTHYKTNYIEIGHCLINAAKFGHYDLVDHLLTYIKCSGQIYIIRDAHRYALQKGHDKIVDLLDERLLHMPTSHMNFTY